MSDDNPNEDNKQDTAPKIEEQARSVFSRIIELGNKKYGFNFEVHGWIIAIVTFLLLVLILK